MDVGYAVSAWNEYIRPYGSKGHYLVSPSVASTNTALQTMQTFLSTCGKNSDGVDDNCGVRVSFRRLVAIFILGVTSVSALRHPNSRPRTLFESASR